MKYLLLYKVDELSKSVFLKSYLEDGFEVAFKNDNCILLRKNNHSIIDENIYINVLFSYIKRSELFDHCEGKIIDLTRAFQYADGKNGFSKFDNQFVWYVRNIITRELIGKYN